MAIMYDVDLPSFLIILLKRVWKDIEDYRKMNRENNDIHGTQDIPLGT